MKTATWIKTSYRRTVARGLGSLWRCNVCKRKFWDLERSTLKCFSCGDLVDEAEVDPPDVWANDLVLE